MVKDQQIKDQLAAEAQRVAKLDLEMAADRLSKARQELTKAESAWKKAQLKYFNSLPAKSP